MRMFDDLSALARSLGSGLGALKRDLDRKIGRTEQPVIVCYRGYAHERRAKISGRVLRDPGITRAAARELWWRNLLNTYKRIESNEVPGARVRVHSLGSTLEVRANDEGYFHAIVPGSTSAAGLMWQPVDLELIEPRPDQGQPPRSTGQVMVVGSDAEFGVISDLDDTVIRTDVRSVPRMIRAVALGNAHTRLPFPGVAAFYRALQRGRAGRPVNPIFYVSSSPWNLYDLLDEFLAVRAIPAGPLILRDWGMGVNPARHAPHKLEAITSVLDTYPGLPFVLIGDSGQEDPEIYREVIARDPARIRAAYIRNVSPETARSAAIQNLIREVRAAGSTMVLADDTRTAAQHAVQHGWIVPESIAEIEADEAAENEDGPASDDDADPADSVVVDPELDR
jgi:phosphatidate phosphatase APP1